MGKAGRLIFVVALGVALTGCDGKPAAPPTKPAAQAAKPLVDISAYATRRAGCNHWSGEDGTDATRRAEINRAMAALKCDQIDQDEAALLQQYSGQPQQLQQIRTAHDKLL